jgi:hypothetical protein
MRSFIYEALPGRIVFGVGASREKLAGEVDRLGARRVLLVATERERPLAEKLAQLLDDRLVGSLFCLQISNKSMNLRYERRRFGSNRAAVGAQSPVHPADGRL